MSEDSRSWLSRLLGRQANNIPPQTADPCADPDLMSAEVDCGQVHATASDFIDGDSPTSFSDRVKEHLGLCDDCDGWMKSLATTVGLIREIPQEDVPDSLKEKIRDISRNSEQTS